MIIYLISDTGIAYATGPKGREMADALIAVGTYRECTKAEYEAQRRTLGKRGANAAKKILKDFGREGAS